MPPYCQAEEIIETNDSFLVLSNVYQVDGWKVTKLFWRCPWCNGYRRREWTRRHEFKSWTRLIAFHLALIPLGKV